MFGAGLVVERLRGTRGDRHDVGAVRRLPRRNAEPVPPPVPDPRSVRGTGEWKSDPELVVFVDLDGVVSPIMVSENDVRYRRLAHGQIVQPKAPPLTGWDDWTFESNPIVPVPRSLLENLAALAALPTVEIAWLTSWCENANTLFDDLGVGSRLPIYQLGPLHADEAVTKWSTVVDQHRQRAVPFVWIDDRLGLDEATWARSLDVDSLLIRTNTFHGITRDCWDHIEAWIAERLGDTDAASPTHLDPKDRS